MISFRLTGLTAFMIYLGTLLLSILSFFTTYNGMTILLDKNLALVGSLGLQIVLLGIAWSLMKMRQNRITYMAAFGVAAVFSIFFSFVNFDTGLQENTRALMVRGQYSEALKETLGEYSRIAEQAAMKGRYQVSRLNKLLELEREKGWATIVDEGSRDDYIQSIIDGARATVKSWEENQGEDYRQGKGKGIIVNYLESSLSQANDNLELVDRYIRTVDSLTLTLNGAEPIDDQIEIATKAWISFPVSEAGILTSTSIHIPMPPDRNNYVEHSRNRQQAFMLVLNDLLEMNNLALFALLLAIAIDFIIIIMAFAGSHIVGDVEHIFDRLKRETNRQMNKLSLDNTEELTRALQTNMEKYRKASEYGIDVSRLIWEYKNARKNFRVTLNKNGEVKTDGKEDRERQIENF